MSESVSEISFVQKEHGMFLDNVEMIERYLKKMENRSEGGSSLEDGQLELMVHRQDLRCDHYLYLYHDHDQGNWYNNHQAMSIGRLLWRR